MKSLVRYLVVPALVFAMGCAAGPPAGLSGAYRFDDGRIVSIRHSTGSTLRYRIYPTGESKRLHPDGKLRYVAGGFAEKSPAEVRVTFTLGPDDRASSLQFTPVAGATEVAMRVDRAQDVWFTSDSVELYGRLDFPAGEGPHPAIVLVHGSGRDAGTKFLYDGDFFARHGIAVLTFDKRGTGRSEGEYTFDFHQLARDVVAAVDCLKARDDIDASRIGLSGYSQGGWVAPLAASLDADVAFVLVSYGLIASPAEEARVETRHELRRRGVDEASLDEVDELTRAAIAIVASDFEEGWETFDRLQRHFEHSPWRSKLSGTVLGDFLRYPKWLIKLLGRRRAPRGQPWHYDSRDVLRTLDIPMTWMIAGDDRMAPPELVVPMLSELIEAGKPYELVVFDDTDHGMLRFHEIDGQRVYTGYAGEYWQHEVDAAVRRTSITALGQRGTNPR